MKQLYDGKTKTVLLDEETGVVNLLFKDSATGEDGVFDPGSNTVGGSVEGKGKAGLTVSCYFFELMEKNGIPTHYLGQISKRDLCRFASSQFHLSNSYSVTKQQVQCADVLIFLKESYSILATRKLLLSQTHRAIRSSQKDSAS